MLKWILILIFMMIVNVGCVSVQCPDKRVWMLDPYLYKMGYIAPLLIDPGDLDNPDMFYTDEEFAEAMGVTPEELIKRFIETEKNDGQATPTLKGTI